MSSDVPLTYGMVTVALGLLVCLNWFLVRVVLFCLTHLSMQYSASTVVSHKYVPPFATLAIVQSAGGLYAGCDIFSCDYDLTFGARPQLHVQIEEDNAFDDFSVAI